MSRIQRLRRQQGLTLIELVVVAALLAIMAAVVLPSAKNAFQRSKEVQLRAALRELRYAIDEYKRFSDAGLIEIDLGTDGYPEEIELLVEGVELIGQFDREVKFMRRIPIDPMTGEAEWGMRSYQDDWDADSWGGEDVFDVYSLSGAVGLNGVPYSLW